VEAEVIDVRSLPPGMRDKVLAAAQLFADHGLDATKMEDVAAATGVPKATLYYYFEGKEDILAFLFGEILDEVGRAVEGAVEAEGTAADRLRALVVAHLRVFEEHPAASRALQFDLGRAARIPLIDERIEAAYRGPVRRLLEEGAADGSLRVVAHPRLVAVAILGAVTTVGINAITLGRPRAVEDVADDVLDLVLHGVGA
jgi:AcrR family transcriptional regulator